MRKNPNNALLVNYPKWKGGTIVSRLVTFHLTSNQFQNNKLYVDTFHIWEKAEYIKKKPNHALKGGRGGKS